MSLTTWREEFYPFRATEVEPGLPSIEHSLKKWTGALPENLTKHGCRYEYHRIYENDVDTDYINFDSDSCERVSVARAPAGSFSVLRLFFRIPAPLDCGERLEVEDAVDESHKTVCAV